MEPDNKDGGSIMERAAAFAPSSPALSELLPLSHAVRLIEVAYGQPKHAAAKFLVNELQGPAYDLPLYWLLQGGEVLRLRDVRVPMEPEAIPTGSTCTHYPSERDGLLGDLSMALVFGHMIGDPGHKASRKAEFLHLLTTDFDRHFIDPLPVPEPTPEAAEAQPQPEAVAPPPSTATRKPTAAQPPRWTDEHLQTLVNVVDAERRKNGPRGAVQRVIDDWGQHFPTRPQVSRPALDKALEQAKKKRIKPTSTASWIPSFGQPAAMAEPTAQKPGRIHKLGD